MDLKEQLERLNRNFEQMNKSANVQTAANTPAPKSGAELPAESKSFTAAEQEEEYVNPLRKSFEKLAKKAPGQFAVLGTTKTLDDPYGFLRQKNADGSYVVTKHQLEAIIVATKQVNDEDPIANGAVSFHDWMHKSGSPAESIQSRMEGEFSKGTFGDHAMILQRALSTDSGSGGPLIRTDLEPMLHEAFLRTFPALEVIPKIPANGLVHSFVQQTAEGDAALVSELGDISATNSDGTYGVQTSTNIAVAANLRQVGLKMQYASRQSGMSFNLAGSQNTEVVSAIRAISKLFQALIFQGNQNSSANSAVANDEDGAYNANGFTGLRQQLKGGSYSINKASDESYLNVLRRAVGQLINAGADLSSVLMFLSVGAQNAIDSELEQFYSFTRSEATGAPNPTNFGSVGIRMLRDIIARSNMIPANSQATGIGYYDYSAVSTEDIYALDPDGIKLPYLGSPNPVILELPLGYNNKLANVYIPFMMMGLALYVKGFNRKIRITKQTV